MRISQTNISEEELIELVANHGTRGCNLLYQKYSTLLYGNTAIDFTQSKEFQINSRFSSEYVLVNHSGTSDAKVGYNRMSKVLKLLFPKSKMVLEVVYMTEYTQSEAVEYVNIAFETGKNRLSNSWIALRKTIN